MKTLSVSYILFSGFVYFNVFIRAAEQSEPKIGAACAFLVILSVFAVVGTLGDGK